MQRPGADSKRRHGRVLIACSLLGLLGCHRGTRVPEAVGTCVPVVCPVDAAREVEGRIRAARMVDRNVELLVDGIGDAGVVGPPGHLHRIELPREPRVASEDSERAMPRRADVPWGVEAARATSDGFVLLLRTSSYASRPEGRNAVPLAVWRIRDSEVEWRSTIDSGKTLDAYALSVSDDEVAIAYPRDQDDTANQVFVVEQRSLATGVLLSSRRFDPPEWWSTAALQHTTEGLALAWAPKRAFHIGTLRVSPFDRPSTRVRASGQSGVFTLTKSGRLVRERSSFRRPSILLDEAPVVEFERGPVYSVELSAIETEMGTAVAFSSKSVEGQYTGIIGDSGEILVMEKTVFENAGDGSRERYEIAEIDGQRLLLAQGEWGDATRRLSIVTCADSEAAAGLSCWGPGLSERAQGGTEEREAP